MRMEYLEILLANVKKQYIDLIIRQELGITTNLVASSHFFDKLKNKDMEYGEIPDLVNYFSAPNTGNIFIKELTFGERINNVMLVMSFEDGFGDITLNFTEHDFITDDINILKAKVINIVDRLVEIQRKYDINNIRFGYESVIDNDNLVLNIDNGIITVPNKFQGQLALAIECAYK